MCCIDNIIYRHCLTESLIKKKKCILFCDMLFFSHLYSDISCFLPFDWLVVLTWKTLVNIRNVYITYLLRHAGYLSGRILMDVYMTMMQNHKYCQNAKANAMLHHRMLHNMLNNILHACFMLQCLIKLEASLEQEHNQHLITHQNDRMTYLKSRLFKESGSH